MSIETPHADMPLDIRYLSRQLVRYWYVILAFVVVGAVLGIVQTHGFQRKYVASMTVLPETGQDLLGRGGSAVSGVASAIGLGVAGKETTTFDRLRFVVASPELAATLDKEHGLIKRLLVGDAPTQEPSPAERGMRDEIRHYLKIASSTEVNAESLALYLKGVVQFRKVRESEFWEVRVEHPDPVIAEFLLTIVYNAADNFVRQQDRARLAERKVYLERRLQEANLSELRIGLVGALIGEEQRMMLLSANLPYAARIVIPGYLSSHLTEPNLLVTLIAPMLAAGGIAIVLITLFVTFRDEAARS